jgi:hypothetical protein
MELAAEDRSAQSPSAAYAAFLASWLIPQTLVLALCALRVGLWARAPRASELFALPIVLCVQVTLPALMFPKMKGECALLALAAAWPMGFLAGLLGASPLTVAIRSEAAISIWIFTVALSSQATKTWAGCGPAWVISIIWSLGGALLFYLRQEFSSTPHSLAPFLAGPIVCAIQIASQGGNFWFVPLLSSTAISGAFFALSPGPARPRVSK